MVVLQHTDYNKRPAEEQVYAEPILVNHPVNLNNPLGTTIIIMVVAMTMMTRTRVPPIWQRLLVCRAFPRVDHPSAEMHPLVSFC